MPENTEQSLRGLAPPSSLEAEISVLGAMLQDAAVVLRAMEATGAGLEDWFCYRRRAELRAPSLWCQ